MYGNPWPKPRQCRLRPGGLAIFVVSLDSTSSIRQRETPTLLAGARLPTMSSRFPHTPCQLKA